jgi:nitrogen-specific signal transduction histidine kinase
MSKKTGMFLIKEAALFKNFSYEVRCIVPETFNDQILMVFKKSTKSQIYNQDQFIIFDETFSILSHEINNPLSSIKMASQLILKSKKYDEELHKIVINETERISKIFESLSFINSKNSLLDGSNENIHEIIRYSVFRLKEKKIIKIIEDFDPSLPIVRVDKSAMVQVFDNLLLNSVDATANNDNAYIKLTTKFLYGQSIKIPNLKNQIKKNYLQIIIEDNGIGIKPNDLEKIFIPFFTKKKNGSGIGLFLVKKIIDFHNGEISINIEDNCTKVYIKLPL